MAHKHTPVIVAVLLLLAAAAVPATASASSTMTVDVEQAPDGEVIVTATSNGSAVENATLVVDADNGTYVGEGEYSTGDDGSIGLDAPEEDVTVEFTVIDGNDSAATTVELLAPSLDVEVDQADGGTPTVTVTYAITDTVAENATVNVSTVDENATYEGVGEYETDENGTVTLDAPSENVTVRVDAAKGDLEGSEQVELLVATDDEGEADSFGASVSAFVRSLLGGDREGGIGHLVAEFVLANNPGNAPDHAGPPEDGERGKPAFVEDRDDRDENATERGGVAAAGADGGGPPDHAKNDDGDGDDDDRERPGNAGGDHPDKGNARGR